VEKENVKIRHSISFTLVFIVTVHHGEDKMQVNAILVLTFVSLCIISINQLFYDSSSKHGM